MLKCFCVSGAAARMMTFAAAGLVLAAGAATVDLAGAGRTVSDLSDADGWTNSGAETVTLRVESDVDAVYGGVISGNVKLEKAGAGVLSLTGANTHSGGTTVRGGTLAFTREDAFGAGDVTLTEGGCARYDGAEGLTLAKNYTVTGTGALSVREAGVQVKVSSAHFASRTIGQTFIKRGAGKLYVSTALGPVDVPTRWTVAEGTMQHYGSDTYGNHKTTTTNLVIDVREGARFELHSGHCPVGAIELTGGTFFHTSNWNYSGQWLNTAFKGGVKVNASATRSVLEFGPAHLNHYAGTNTVFDVAAGAELLVNGRLTNGWFSGTSEIDNKLIKRGGGRLILLGDNGFTGGLDVEAGSLQLERLSAAGRGPVTLAAGTEVCVPAGAAAEVPALVCAGTVRKTGGGELIARGVSDAAHVAVEAGTCAFPTYADAAAHATYAAGTAAGIGDFAANAAAAFAAYVPNGVDVVYAGTAPLVYGDLTVAAPAVDAARVGAVFGSDITFGTVAGARALTLTGLGTTRLAAVGAGTESLAAADGATVYLPEGLDCVFGAGVTAVTYPAGSSDAWKAALVLSEDNGVVTVPTGVTLTLTNLTRAAGATARLHLRKRGGGTLVMPERDHSGVYEGTYVEEGTVEIKNLSNLGFGSVYLCGGTIRLKQSVSLDSYRRKFVVTGRGAFDLPEGVALTAVSNYFVTANAVFTKRGAGTLKISGPFTEAFSVGGARWVVEEGLLERVDDQTNFAAYNEKPRLTIEVNEGGELRTDKSHLTLGDVVLRGGTLRGAFSPVGYAGEAIRPAETVRWKCLSLNGTVTAEPSRTGVASVIAAPVVSLANGDFQTVFDVAAGAELRIDATVFPGWRQWNSTVNDSVHNTRGAVKRGAGALVVNRAFEAGGAFALEAGTVTFGPEGRLTENTALGAAAGTTVALEDGASLALGAAGLSVSGGTELLREAAVWLDAAAVEGAAGDVCASVPNLGTAGGAFERFTRWADGETPFANLPGAPTLAPGAVNGHNALAVNGTQALVLTNFVHRGDDATVYVVYQWDNWTSTGGQGKWGSAFALASAANTLDDYDSPGALLAQHSGEDVGEVKPMPGDRKAVALTTGIANGQPLLLMLDRTRTNLLARAYWADGDEGTVQGLLTNNNGAMNVDRVAAGIRLGNAGGAIHWRALIGKFCEMAVFPRALSDEEKACVEAYLKRKWFASATPVVTARPDAAKAVRVDVAAGARAALVAGATAAAGQRGFAVEKTGAGALALGLRTDGGPAAVTAAAGTLELAPGRTASRADIWLDADDAASLTIVDGKVTAAVNKGRAGGVFVQGRGRTSVLPGVPVYNAAGINGRGTLDFNGGEGLFLGTYTNKESMSLQVYAMFQATRWEAAGGKGKWAGPFTFGSVEMTVDDNDNTSRAFHFEQGNETTLYHQLAGVSGGASDTLNLPLRCGSGAGSAPYLYQFRADGYGRCAMMELAEDDPDGAIPCQSYSRTSGTPYNPLRIDCLTLGGRMTAGGKFQYYNPTGDNRMWFGRVGEFIVFTHPLARAEERELLAYLRKKWYNKGEGSAAPPAFLAGHDTAPELSAATELAAADGTALVTGGACQPLGALALGADVTWTVANATADPAEVTRFAVAGDVELAGPATLALATAPAENARLLTCAGTISGAGADTALWTLDFAKSGLYRLLRRAGGLELVRTAGTIFIFR